MINRNSPGGSQRPAKPSHLENEEQVALEALHKYNPDAINPHVFNIVPDFFGGTLCLIELGEKDDDGDREEWCVLVKDGCGTVYYDYESVLMTVAASRSFISEISSPNVVLAAISIIILLASVIFYIMRGFLEEPFRSALTAVLAFWFGKSVPTK